MHLFSNWISNIISVYFSLKMDWINSKYKHSATEWNRNKLNNKFKIYSKYKHWIWVWRYFKFILCIFKVYSLNTVYKPMIALRAICHCLKLWDYHIWKVGDCWHESGGGVGHFQGGIPGKVQPEGGARNPFRKLNGGEKKLYGHWYLCIGLTLAIRKNPTGWSAFISWNVSEYVKICRYKLQVSTIRQISLMR